MLTAMEEAAPVCDHSLLSVVLHNTQLMIVLVMVLIRTLLDSVRDGGKIKSRLLRFAENRDFYAASSPSFYTWLIVRPEVPAYRQALQCVVTAFVGCVP